MIVHEESCLMQNVKMEKCLIFIEKILFLKIFFLKLNIPQEIIERKILLPACEVILVVHVYMKNIVIYHML